MEPMAANTRMVVANKAFTMRDESGDDISYVPGDPVDVTHLPDHKVSQLLNQRLLRPAPPAGKDI